MTLNASFETYRYVVACTTCGVVDAVELEHQVATQPAPVEGDPAFEHFVRTGHEVFRLNYTLAPADVREMLDTGGLEGIDFHRVIEWLRFIGEGGGGYV